MNFADKNDENLFLNRLHALRQLLLGKDYKQKVEEEFDEVVYLVNKMNELIIEQNR